MPADHPARARLAEIITSRAGRPSLRGSGYVIAPGWVLTCWHVVADATGIGVWLRSPAVLDPDDGAGVDPASIVAFRDLDVALVPVQLATEAVEPVLWGRLDRDSSVPVPVVAAGFPRFKLRPTRDRPDVLVRELHFATGHIQASSNRKTTTLELSVAGVIPRADTEPAQHSPWEGMSGAAVWAGNRVVGVVGQHHPSEGPATLTVLPVDDLLRGLRSDELIRWRAALPTAPHSAEELAVASPPSERQLTVRRAHAAAQRSAPDPPILVARENELARLRAFTESDERWRWVQGAPFAGKSALLAWFALHPPPQVDVAACFLRRIRAGENTFVYVLDILSRQLTALAGQMGYTAASYPSERVDDFLDLLPLAAQACRERRCRLLLLIDGLDEYQATAPDLDLDAWLPDDSTLPQGAQLLASSRLGTSLPALPERHPLRGAIEVIPPSEAAQDIQEQANRELQAALEEAAGALTMHILASLAAAETGLTAEEVAALLRKRGDDPDVSEVRRPLDTAFHRALVPLPDQTHPEELVYSFAHATLLTAATEHVRADLPRYRSLLDEWADEYADRSWPPDTPRYLHLPYTAQLVHRAQTADTSTECRDAVDRAHRTVSHRHRHGRVLARSGNPALADQEIADVQHVILGTRELSALAADEVVYRLAVLALRRRPFTGHAAEIAADVAGIWASCGRVDAAVTLAEHIHGARARGSAFVHIAKALAYSSAPERALSTAEVIDEVPARDEAFLEVARALARAGNADGAIGAAEQIQDARDRSRALAGVAEVLAAAGRSADALDVAARIDDPRHGARARTLIAARLQASDDLSGALLALARIDDPLAQDRALTLFAERALRDETIDRAIEAAAGAQPPELAGRVLSAIAQALAAAGSRDAAASVAQRALELERGADGGARSTSTLLTVTDVLRGAGAGAYINAADRTLAAARQLDDPAEQARAYVSVARALAMGGDAARALAAVELIGDPYTCARGLGETARALAMTGRAGLALEAAERITDPWIRVTAFTDCVSALAHAGASEGAAQAAERAERGVSEVANPDLRARALLELAEALNADVDSDRAVATAARIEPPEPRIHALTGLAGMLARAGRNVTAVEAADRALVSIDEVRRPVMRRRALNSLAQAYAAAGEVDQATSVACRIEDGQMQAQTLGEIAQTLASLGRDEDALDAADGISDTSGRDRALSDVALTLAAGGRVQAAVAATSRIADRAVQCRGFAELTHAAAARGDVDAVRAAAQAMCDDGERVRALCHAVGLLAADVRTDAALTIARETRSAAIEVISPGERSVALACAGQALLTAGDATAAEELTAMMDERDDRAALLSDIAKALGATGAGRRALETAEHIDEPRLRAGTLVAMSRMAASAGDTGLALQAAERALAAADRIAARSHQRGLLTVLTHTVEVTLPGAAVERVRHTLNEIHDPAHRAQALSAVKQALEVDVNRALETAQAIDDAAHAAQALVAVAQTLAAAGRNDGALRAAETARAAATALHDAGARTQALTAVAATFARAGDTDRAFATAEGVDDAAGRALGVTQVARALADAGHHEARDAARRAATAIAELGEAADVAPLQAEIALTLATAGDTHGALAATERIPDVNARVSAAVSISRAVDAAGANEDALEVTVVAARSAAEIEHPYHQARALSEVAGAYADLGSRAGAVEAAELARAAAQRVDDPYLQAQALTNSAAAFARAGDGTRALDVARQIAEEAPRSVALATVGQALAVAGDAETALAAVAELDDPDNRARGFIDLANAFISRGRLDHALVAARHGAEAVHAIEQLDDRAAALAPLAHVFVRAGDPEQALAAANSALQAAQRIEEPSSRLEAFTPIPAALAAAGATEQAMALVDNIADRAARTEALTAVAETFAHGRPTRAGAGPHDEAGSHAGAGPDDEGAKADLWGAKADEDMGSDPMLRRITEEILLTPEAVGALRVLPTAILSRLVVEGQLC